MAGKKWDQPELNPHFFLDVMPWIFWLGITFSAPGSRSIKKDAMIKTTANPRHRAPDTHLVDINETYQKKNAAFKIMFKMPCQQPCLIPCLDRYFLSLPLSFPQGRFVSALLLLLQFQAILSLQSLRMIPSPAAGICVLVDWAELYWL